MDKDRMLGMARQAKGSVKQAVDGALDDATLAADGRADSAERKVQNALGGVKDALRETIEG